MLYFLPMINHSDSVAGFSAWNFDEKRKAMQGKRYVPTPFFLLQGSNA